MKKIFTVSILLAIFWLNIPTIANAEQANLADDDQNISANHEVNLYLFHSESCPHCQKEIEFLDEIAPEYPRLNIYKYEISRNRDNLKLFQRVAEKMGEQPNGVPFTIIGDETYVGYSETYHNTLFENKISELLNDPNYNDTIPKIINAEALNDEQKIGFNTSKEGAEPEGAEPEEGDRFFSIPILGEISAKSVSLPLLTLVLGFVDGFNPCAMWILIFLISMLIGLKNRKRRWVLGLAFIITSAISYFVFMSLWLNLIIFLGFIIWIRVGIGLVALGGGAYSLKKGLKNKAGCDVTGEERRKKILERMKNVVHRESFWLAFLGITLLAFSVNLVELICSAGLPAVFTQVLVLNNLSTIQYYLYIAFYVLIFMLDDIIVFAVAMATMELTGLTTKYSKITRIIGGVVMIIIGILLLFKPEWIMFG